MTLLREAGHNPDEHLTDEQRELLISAEYYDRLNVATAYFPEQNGGQALMQEGGPVIGQPGDQVTHDMDPGVMGEGATDQIEEEDEMDDGDDGEEDPDAQQAEGDEEQQQAYPEQIEEGEDEDEDEAEAEEDDEAAYQ